jgi:hypothetical protein
LGSKSFLILIRMRRKEDDGSVFKVAGIVGVAALGIGWLLHKYLGQDEK